MDTQHAQDIVTSLTPCLRKPARNWWLSIDFTVAVAGTAAAIALRNWWLLFIPAIALTEAAAVWLGGLFTEVLQHKDQQIEQLRRQLGAR